MSDQSSNLSLPYILPSQAQKHVTHNEAIDTLDALVQSTVVNQTTTSPPSTPNSGDSYIIADSSTGDWSGRDQHIAVWQDTGWVYLVPQVGWRVWDQEHDEMVVFDGSAWVFLIGPQQNLDFVGINTTADTTNRLSVAADATLLTHDGADHQLKLNKATPGDTASLLFQTNYDGKIEAGLSGNDNFNIKYNSNGTLWRNGICLETDTGFCGIGTAAPARALHIVGDSPVLRIQDNTATTGNGARSMHEFCDSAKVVGWMGYTETTEHFFIRNNNTNGDLRLNGATNVTISNNGNVGVGTHSPIAKLHVVGDVRCTSLTETSDVRMKTAIATPEESGAVLDNIRIVKYDWADGYGHVPYGLIAQELAQVVPDAVVQGDDGDAVDDDTIHWGIRQAPLVSLLIHEVQALRKRIAALETKGRARSKPSQTSRKSTKR